MKTCARDSNKHNHRKGGARVVFAHRGDGLDAKRCCGAVHPKHIGAYVHRNEALTFVAKRIFTENEIDNGVQKFAEKFSDARLFKYRKNADPHGVNGAKFKR